MIHKSFPLCSKFNGILARIEATLLKISFNVALHFPCCVYIELPCDGQLTKGIVKDVLGVVYLKEKHSKWRMQRQVFMEVRGLKCMV
jgi:hypothetical protein